MTALNASQMTAQGGSGPRVMPHTGIPYAAAAKAQLPTDGRGTVDNKTPPATPSKAAWDSNTNIA